MTADRDLAADRSRGPALTPPVSGVLPIAPTPFLADEDLDLPSQRRVVDFLVDAGVSGICILANFSEQFSLSDVERDQLTDVVLEQAGCRVPVIVTTSHFSSRIAAERCRRAERAGASMVMLMPPYHGASIRVDEDSLRAFFMAVSEAIDIPVIIQDSPLSGTALPVGLLARLAAEAPNLRHFKIEVPQAAAKVRQLIQLGGASIEGAFGGEEAVSLIAELDAGAAGTMPGSTIPEVLVDVVRLHRAGDREAAVAIWDRWLPLITYENKLCGLQAAKVLLAEGGVIGSSAVRAPLRPLPVEIRDGFLDLARRLNPLALRWDAGEKRPGLL
jgi:4-hydroxy-tetrahydrodipicolinate synthase